MPDHDLGGDRNLEHLESSANDDTTYANRSEFVNSWLAESTDIGDTSRMSSQQRPERNTSFQSPTSETQSPASSTLSPAEMWIKSIESGLLGVSSPGLDQPPSLESSALETKSASQPRSAETPPPPPPPPPIVGPPVPPRHRRRSAVGNSQDRGLENPSSSGNTEQNNLRRRSASTVSTENDSLFSSSFSARSDRSSGTTRQPSDDDDHRRLKCRTTTRRGCDNEVAKTTAARHFRKLTLPVESQLAPSKPEKPLIVQLFWPDS